jgi:hypothetical protein
MACASPRESTVEQAPLAPTSHNRRVEVERSPRWTPNITSTALTSKSRWNSLDRHQRRRAIDSAHCRFRRMRRHTRCSAVRFCLPLPKGVVRAPCQRKSAPTDRRATVARCRVRSGLRRGRRLFRTGHLMSAHSVKQRPRRDDTQKPGGRSVVIYCTRHLVIPKQSLCTRVPFDQSSLGAVISLV